MAPGFEDTELSDYLGAFANEHLEVIVLPSVQSSVGVSDVVDLVLRETSDLHGALLAFGPGATPVWEALPELSHVLRSATFVSVPAVPNLDVSKMINLPVLDVHSQLDLETVRAHQRVHDALSIAGVPHEMVVYDKVDAEFFAKGRPGYNFPTSADAAGRVHDWVMTSILTDDLLKVRNPE